MIRYVIYSPESGKVLRTGMCSSADQVDGQVRDGEVLDDNPPDGVIANGRWHWTGSTYAEEDLTLEALKKAKKNAIRLARDNAEWAGCDTPLGRVDSDPDSQRKLNGSVSMASILGSSFSVEWRMKDNTISTFDSTQMITVGIAVGEYVSACQNRKNELDALLEAATTQAELDAIDLTSGWPT